MRWPWQTKEDGVLARLDAAIRDAEQKQVEQECARDLLRRKIEELKDK